MTQNIPNETRQNQSKTVINRKDISLNHFGLSKMNLVYSAEQTSAQPCKEAGIQFCSSKIF